MVNNNWLCQFLSDILDITVERPIETETTALGAAYLAGLQAGVFESLDDISQLWGSDLKFNASMAEPNRKRIIVGLAKCYRSSYLSTFLKPVGYLPSNQGKT